MCSTHHIDVLELKCISHMKFLVLKGNVQYTSRGPLTCIGKMNLDACIYVIVDYIIYHVMANCWCMVYGTPLFE